MMQSKFPSTWDLKAAVVQQFVPIDQFMCSRDCFRKLKKKASVSRYLDEFCNFTLSIPKMNEGKKMNCFVKGLKNDLRVEVMMVIFDSFDECVFIVLNVNSAICRV